MLKFLVYCILLCHEVSIISANDEFNEAKISVQYSNERINQPTIKVWNLNELQEGRTFTAKIQIFNIAGQSASDNNLFTDICFTKYCHRTLSNSTNEKSEFKLHLEKLPWNRARRICEEEGGHLAIPRADSEEAEIMKMMIADSVDDAWLGIHDQFEEGDWITILGEPLAKIGWSRWSKLFPNNPDNYNGKQHCARLVRNGGGMDDDECQLSKSFVCKMSTL